MKRIVTPFHADIELARIKLWAKGYTRSDVQEAEALLWKKRRLRPCINASHFSCVVVR